MLAKSSIYQLSLVMLATALVASTANAQSGGGRPSTPPPAQAQGSSHQAAQLAGTPAMDGYCPVCLVEMKDWNKGNANFASKYDGQLYLFPGAKQKAMFDANPAKYTPVLGGDDVVVFAKTGRRTPGDLSIGASYGGRFYFFANAANKQAFQAAPNEYANADLALGGECVVCRVDMNHKMAGNPNFTTLYQGIRYQFPDSEAQQAFVGNPTKYTQAIKNPRAAHPGSGHQSPPPSGGGSGNY